MRVIAGTCKSLPLKTIAGIETRPVYYTHLTIDELIGYKPQLSKEQIQKLYQEFAAEFATCPLEEVMEKVQTYVKRYYSCYPFLFQICALWLNHYVLVFFRTTKTARLIATQIAGLSYFSQN